MPNLDSDQLVGTNISGYEPVHANWLGARHSNNHCHACIESVEAASPWPEETLEWYNYLLEFESYSHADKDTNA